MKSTIADLAGLEQLCLNHLSDPAMCCLNTYRLEQPLRSLCWEAWLSEQLSFLTHLLDDILKVLSQLSSDETFPPALLGGLAERGWKLPAAQGQPRALRGLGL